jgi:hypothetical protein
MNTTLKQACTAISKRKLFNTTKLQIWQHARNQSFARAKTDMTYGFNDRPTSQKSFARVKDKKQFEA